MFDASLVTRTSPERPHDLKGLNQQASEELVPQALQLERWFISAPRALRSRLRRGVATWLETCTGIARGPFLLRLLDAIVYPNLPAWVVVDGAVFVCEWESWWFTAGATFAGVRLPGDNVLSNSCKVVDRAKVSGLEFGDTTVARSVHVECA